MCTGKDMATYSFLEDVGGLSNGGSPGGGVGSGSGNASKGEDGKLEELHIDGVDMDDLRELILIDR